MSGSVTRAWMRSRSRSPANWTAAPSADPGLPDRHGDAVGDAGAWPDLRGRQTRRTCAAAAAGSSERDVAVLAAAGRRFSDSPGERLAGLGRLDDLVDDAKRDRALQAACLALVLSGELSLGLVPAFGGHVGEGAPVQDPHEGDIWRKS